MPLLADAAAICRTQVIEDLYGQVRAPTGEPLIHAFSRMISSAVREYPILSSITNLILVMRVLFRLIWMKWQKVVVMRLNVKLRSCICWRVMHLHVIII